MHNRATEFFRTLSRVAGIALLATAAVAAPAQAQQMPMSETQKEKLQALKEAQSEMRSLGQRLAKIERATIASRPELKADKQAYRELVIETMEAGGYSVKENTSELQALKRKAGDESLPKEQRRAARQKLRQGVGELREAQSRAMKDQEVQQARTELGESTIAAMREQNPTTDELIEQLKTTQDEIMKLRTELQNAMGRPDKG